MNIFLVGFMGSGKSTIGRLLAQNLKLTFVDLDKVIEKSEKQSVSEIFSHQGEVKFREIEHQNLKEICQHENQVIAVGGGCPCFHNNMEIMNQNGKSIYLKMSAQALTDRFLALPETARSSRPILANKSKDELLEFIQSLLNVREPFYQKASCIVLNEEHDIYKTLGRIRMALGV